MKFILIITCLLLTVQSAMAASASTPAHIYINPNERRQTIEGFGGGMVFNVYPYIHPEKNALYDSIFNVAKVNVLRVGNWYDPATGEEVTEVPMLLEIQEKWPHVKVILTSWSPPAYLKSNNSLLGADRPTLKKNSDSVYMYKEYADYWYKSIMYFKGKGVRIDWVSIQNEPDWAPLYEGCIFEAVETDSAASYGKALDAVFTKCNVEHDENVKFLGPDVPGVGDNRLAQYIESAEMNRSQIVAYAHHYYDYSGTDWMMLTRNTFNDKPIYQTEFLVSEGKDWAGRDRTWFDHALIINQMLLYENVAMYCLFSLAYKPASTHCLFSLDTLGGTWYQERPPYAMFKQYSRSIRCGWQRILSEATDPAVVVTAFANTTADSLALVLVNTDTQPKLVTFDYPLYTGAAYQTTDSVKYALVKNLASVDTVTLPVRSITTFDLSRGNSGVYHPSKKKNGHISGVFTVTTQPDMSLVVRSVRRVNGRVRVSIFNCTGERLLYRENIAGADGRIALTIDNKGFSRGMLFMVIQYGNDICQFQAMMGR